jgi:glycine cleavage system pyridoxal-binding protein P
MADQTSRASLAELERRDAFVARHIGTSPDDQRAMLATLGFASCDALIDAIVPAAIRDRARSRCPRRSPSTRRSRSSRRSRRGTAC